MMRPVLSHSDFDGSSGFPKEILIADGSLALADLWNFESFSVLAFDQRVTLLGILAYKATCLGVQFHPVAHAQSRVVGLDSMGV
jgi:hypothetical protein